MYPTRDLVCMAIQRLDRTGSLAVSSPIAATVILSGPSFSPSLPANEKATGVLERVKLLDPSRLSTPNSAQRAILSSSTGSKSPKRFRLDLYVPFDLFGFI